MRQSSEAVRFVEKNHKLPGPGKRLLCPTPSGQDQDQERKVESKLSQLL